MKSLKLFLSVLLLFTIQSCKDSSNPAISISKNFIYPLKIANQWKYNISMSYSNFRPDSIKATFSGFSYEANVFVAQDTVINSHKVMLMKEVSSEYSTAYSYYANEESGLIEYAYSNTASSVLPKINSATRLIYHGKSYGSVEEIINQQKEIIKLSKTSYDSVIYFNEPRTIYKYPLNIGQEWLFNPSVIIINKEVVGKENVQTDAGTYECFKIKWNYYSDNNTYNDLFCYEYVGVKGMIKTEITIKNITVATIDNPDGIGLVDVNYKKILTGVNF